MRRDRGGDCDQCQLLNGIYSKSGYNEQIISSHTTLQLVQITLHTTV